MLTRTSTFQPAKIHKKSHISKYMGNFLQYFCFLQHLWPFLAHFSAWIPEKNDSYLYPLIFEIVTGQSPSPSSESISASLFLVLALRVIKRHIAPLQEIVRKPLSDILQLVSGTDDKLSMPLRSILLHDVP